MLTITSNAVAFLKAAILAEGSSPNAGIRIQRGPSSQDDGAVAVGLAVSHEPAPGDKSLEEDGLRIFVDDALIKPLDGRTLDVRKAGDRLEFVFR